MLHKSKLQYIGESEGRNLVGRRHKILSSTTQTLKSLATENSKTWRKVSMIIDEVDVAHLWRPFPVPPLTLLWLPAFSQTPDDNLCNKYQHIITHYSQIIITYHIILRLYKKQ